MEDSPQPPSPPELAPPVIELARPWGPWGTLGLGLLICVIWILAQTVIAVVMVFGNFLVDRNAGEQLQYDGDLLGMATVGSGIAAIIAIFFFVWLRKYPSADYLGLRFPWRWWIHFPLWLGITYGLGHLFGFLAPFFDREEIPEFMQKAFLSTDYMILLWLGVAVMAPLFEEFFFRGFLYAGWRRSALGWTGTAVLTSLLWAIIHVQYGMYEITCIFVLGLVFSAAREITGSLWIPIAMHGLNNAIAIYVTQSEMTKAALGG
ncbi:MAG: type II CAAX endopeptidase family protein [Verrucomicrobiota bacterium]